MFFKFKCGGDLVVMTAVNLFIFLSFMIVSTFLSIAYKALKKMKLSKDLKYLQQRYNTQAERCKVIRNLSTDYFNSIGMSSQGQILEMGKILDKISKEIRDIHYLLNKNSLKSLNLAQERLRHLRGVGDSLNKKINSSQQKNLSIYNKTVHKKPANKRNDYRKPTWEFEINKLVEVGAVQIMKASRQAKSFGLETRNRTRKATTEILAGIAFVPL